MEDHRPWRKAHYCDVVQVPKLGSNLAAQHFLVRAAAVLLSPEASEVAFDVVVHDIDSAVDAVAMPMILVARWSAPSAELPQS